MNDDKLGQLTDLALFEGCTPDEIKAIGQLGDGLDVPAGTVLATGGRTVREFVVILEGAASSEDVIFGPGSFYGELGLLDGRPHPMTIEAVGPARLLVFGPREFRALLQRVPSVSTKLMRELAARVRVLDQDVRSLRAVS
jgi:CRP/FNR family cyclic AMP-dependent transcriptional regulator